MNMTLEKMTIPIIQGGMGIGISMGGLAGAVAKEGGMGVIAAAGIGFREPDFYRNPIEAGKRALQKEVQKAREISEGNGLIGVNIMSAASDYEAMARCAAACGVDAVISGAGLPLSLPEYIPEGSGTMIAPVVSSGRAAKVILRDWQRHHRRKPDFLVVEGSLAGGHLGFKPEDLANGTCKALAENVEDVIKEATGIPVFAAGGVFDREDVRKLLAVGASGVQLGTRFALTREGDASQAFKDVLLHAREEDIRIITSPVGMPGRAVVTPLIEAVSVGERRPPEHCVNCIRVCNPATTKYCINRALIAAFHGDYENGLFFTGANVSRIHEMTNVHELMQELNPFAENEGGMQA